MATVDRSPIPVPPRTSLRQLKPFRRPLTAVYDHPPLPANASTNAQAKRAARRVTIHPASPEVISSLISSLSAISAPAEDLFDNLPFIPLPASTSTLVGQNRHTTVKGNAVAGFGMDYGAFKSQNQPTPVEDNAAIAPVIRTAKPPSGFSPLTAPKRKSMIKNTPSSSISSTPTDTSQSIGNLSIEPGPLGVSAFSNPTMRGSRTQKALNLKESREKMRDLDRERRRKATETGNRSPTSLTFARLGRTPTITPPASPLSGKFPSSTATRTASQSPARKSRPMNEQPPIPGVTSTFGEEAPGEVGNGKVIPTRNSSLRQTLAANSKRKRIARSGLTVDDGVEKESSPPTETSVEDSVDVPEAAKTSEDQEEDEVTRRIKQLKAQKALRDRTRSNASQKSTEGEKPEKSRSRAHSSLPAPSLPHVEQTRSASATRAVAKEVHRPAVDVAVRRHTSLSHKHRSFVESPAGRRIKSRPTSVEVDRTSTANSLDDAVESYLSAPRLSQKIQHPTSGRTISFSDVGDPDGCVIFCCVGMGLTRYLTAFYDELALTLGLRLITPDRPGVGSSELDSEGTPLTWPGT